MFDRILQNYWNGNISDYKKLIKKLKVEDRAKFIEYIDNGILEHKDVMYFTRMIITKDW